MVAAGELWKAFGARELFAGLSFEVAAGQTLALVGPSGAGKTTLLRLLGGLAHPDRGEVTVDGRRLAALGARALARLRAERMGFVFQSVNLLPHLNVLENILLPGLFRPAGKRLGAGPAGHALAEVGLGGMGGQLAGTLSGGEAQRAALARALAARPALLLCDEPTGNLDAQGRETIGRLLLETCRSLGCAAVVATHDGALADACQRKLRLGQSSK